MTALAPYVGGTHQRAPQLSPLTATAPLPRRYGPDTAGRPTVVDPRTGQSVCTSPGLDGRVTGPTATLLHPAAAPASALHHRSPTAGLYGPPTDKTYAQYTLDPSLYYPPTMAAGRAVCYPYDLSTMQYPYYGDGYGAMDLNGARRKNATRETTSTLKAWLYEHRKNPYPTKGEKIMLAIITKMTLTQVSTWFANARRRLKKENKMTWSPRNRCGDDRKEDYESEEGEEDQDPDREDDMDGLGTDLDSNHNGQLSDHEGTREENNNEKEDEHDGDREIIVSDCGSGSHGGLLAGEPRYSAGYLPASHSGRDSVSVTVDDDEEDEEDRVTGSPRPVRERPCCGSPPVCHRRPSPGPVPLAPSAIRPTCRPTSRGGGSNTPPCEKVPPLPVRQTEKPKIWSLAHTATSSSPERERRSRSPVRSPLHNGHVSGSATAMPTASLPQNFHYPYDSPMSTLRQWVDGQFHGGLPVPRMSTGLPLHQLGTAAAAAAAAAAASNASNQHQAHRAPTCVVSSSQGPLFSTASGGRHPLMAHEVTPLHNGVSINPSPLKEVDSRRESSDGKEVHEPMRTAFKPVPRR